VPLASVVRDPSFIRPRPPYPPYRPYPPYWWRYPYFVPYPYPVYMPGTVVSTSPYLGDPAPAAPVVAPATSGKELPSVSGPLAVPPPGTAIIRVRVPDHRAQVLFNDEDTTTLGRVRTFVSPTMQPASERTYTVTARWMHEGKAVSQNREVTVSPGQARLVDFTHPAGR
jgi:uncharacterized protein (TIGR03000 family)